MLLALETSCDETALALFDIDGFRAGVRSRDELLRAEIVSSQLKLHEPYGGVVPELAAREHLSNLPPLVRELLKRGNISLKELSAVAVTRGPGLNGCLLVGLSFAKALALGLEIPLIPVNHLEAHMFAAELDAEIREYEYPALSLLVSGGHTELILIERFRKYRVVARTRDDAVGEAFDKCATLLRLPYPGGPALSQLSESGRPGAFSFPRGMPEHEDAFSFSGVKTAVSREVERLGDQMNVEQTRADLAHAVQTALVEALVEKSSAAITKHRPGTLVLTGGVAANSLLRTRLKAVCDKRGLDFKVPEQRWCTDNAAMIAFLAAKILTAGYGPKRTGEANVGALPRWPIESLVDA